MNKENRAVKLFFEIIGFLYAADLLFDLFPPSDQYMIEWDRLRGVATVIFWLPAFIFIVYILAYTLLKKRELGRLLWQGFNVACLGVILLVFAGLVQSIMKMVYGAMLPSDYSSIFLLFSQLPSQRAFYLQSRLLILGAKALGLLFVSVGFTLRLFQIRQRVGKIGWGLMAVLVVIFVYSIVDELNVILELEKYSA